MYDDSPEALCIDLPVLIKARADGDRRLVEVEASNEAVDSEGDVIKQAALLDSAAAFVSTGHLDIDHYSEIGERLGLPNPSDYIVGVPLEVKDLGKGRTGVLGELHKAGRPKTDELWSGLMASPPVRWRASIYGFPKAGMVEDCRVTKSSESGEAKRFIVKGIHWRSLAFTRNPVNDAITGSAHVVTAKSMVAIMKARMPGAKSMSPPQIEGYPAPVPDYILAPRNREELMGHFYYSMKSGRSPFANPDQGYSVLNFQNHFMGMCGCSFEQADILANALMNLLKRERRT
jgi:hypothetical protein